MTTAAGSTGLHVHRYGATGGPVMVLLHGLTDDGTNWPDLVAHLGDTWDVVAVDLRGHGRSPRFTAAELLCAPEVMRADVVRVIDGLGAPAVVVGHSLGGVLALWAALDRPALVRGLVLEDPPRTYAGRTPYPDFVRPTMDFLGLMADPTQRELKIEEMRTQSNWSEAEIDAWAASKPLVDRDYVRKGTYFDDGEWESRFAALTMPTLLVIPPDTESAPDLSLANNPLVRELVIPGAGHCVHRDQPAHYYRELDTFLATLPRP